MSIIQVTRNTGVLGLAVAACASDRSTGINVTASVSIERYGYLEDLPTGSRVHILQPQLQSTLNTGVLELVVAACSRDSSTGINVTAAVSTDRCT